MGEHTQQLETRKVLRERILEKALKEFMENGIKCITMDDIASSLGISKRTLYEVFPDKESLLCECVDRRKAEFEEFIKDVLATASNVLEVLLKCCQRSIENFHATNKNFFEDIKKYPKVYERMMERRDSEAEATINFFRQGVEQGIFRSDVNFAIVNLLVHEQIDLLLNTDICKKYPFIDVYESIMFTYIRGIATVRGAEELEEFIQAYRTKQK